MATKLFVGSLSWNVNETQLKELFSEIGEVTSVAVITDRNSGQSKGFGFVEMKSDDEAKEAIKQLNNKEVDGRNIIVSEAKPREESSSRSFNNGPRRQSSRRY